jgi:hypothetical protein
LLAAFRERGDSLFVGGIVTLPPIDVTVNYARFTESAKDLQNPNITKTAYLARDGWIAETAETHTGSEAMRTSQTSAAEGDPRTVSF